MPARPRPPAAQPGPTPDPAPLGAHPRWCERRSEQRDGEEGCDRPGHEDAEAAPHRHRDKDGGQLDAPPPGRTDEQPCQTRRFDQPHRAPACCASVVQVSGWGEDAVLVDEVAPAGLEDGGAVADRLAAQRARRLDELADRVAAANVGAHIGADLCALRRDREGHLHHPARSVRSTVWDLGCRSLRRTGRRPDLAALRLGLTRPARTDSRADEMWTAELQPWEIEAFALVKPGGPYRSRTGNLRLAKAALCQLS